jgi:MoxR-like ATPases
MVDVMRRTRENKKIYVGASPRTTAKLLLASKSCALVHGRSYVIPEDIYYIMKPMLNHRLILRPEAMLDENDQGADVANKVIEEILSEVQAPR